MARYYSVTIGDISFTRDGLETGKPCKLDVEGLPDLKPSKALQIDIDADGGAWMLATENASVVITVQVSSTLKARFDDLHTLRESLINAESSASVVIEGDSGTFEFDAFIRRIGFGKFHNGYLDDIVIELVKTVEGE